jgi:acetyl-CoA carboxylase carboxyltransferase component
VIFRKEIKAADNPEAKRQEIIANYENLLYNPYIAASRGFLDQVIEPRQTRPRLIEALEVLSTKRESLPPKKHGNIPV